MYTCIGDIDDIQRESSRPHAARFETAYEQSVKIAGNVLLR